MAATPRPPFLAQAVITPFDGRAPVSKTVRLALTGTLAANPIYGVVAQEGLDLNSSSYADSFNSNPSNSVTGPWAGYSHGNSRANTTVVILKYNLNIGQRTGFRRCDAGCRRQPPMASKVTGTIKPNFTGTFPMPAYPTPADVSRSYNKGSKLPAKLPGGGDLPAADGRYYYFCSGATIAHVTIAAGNDVTIVGTNTDMLDGLVVPKPGDLYHLHGQDAFSRREHLGQCQQLGRGAQDLHDHQGRLRLLQQQRDFRLLLCNPTARCKPPARAANA